MPGLVKQSAGRYKQHPLGRAAHSPMNPIGAWHSAAHHAACPRHVAAVTTPATHLCLAVSGGGEDLGLLGGDGGVAGDELGHDAAQRLNAQAAGREQHVCAYACEGWAGLGWGWGCTVGGGGRATVTRRGEVAVAAAPRREPCHWVGPRGRRHAALGTQLGVCSGKLAGSTAELHGVMWARTAGGALACRGRAWLEPPPERGHVQQQDVLDVAAQDTALDGRAHGHNLQGVSMGAAGGEAPHTEGRRRRSQSWASSARSPLAPTASHLAQPSQQKQRQPCGRSVKPAAGPHGVGPCSPDHGAGVAVRTAASCSI